MKIHFNQSIIFELFVQIIPIPASIIINRLLGSDDRGQLAELLLIPSIISTIIACNWDKLLKGQLLNSSISLQNIISRTSNLFIFQYSFVILFGLLLFISGYWAKNQDFNFIIIVISIHGILQLLSNYFISIYSCVASSTDLYKIKLFAAIAYFLIVLLFMFLFNLNIYIAFFINMIIPLIYICLIIYKSKLIWINLSFKLNLNFKDFILKLKYLPVVLFETISNNIDLLILSYFASHGVLGAYLSLKIIEFPFKIISQAFINVITPLIPSLTKLIVIKIIYLLILLISSTTFVTLFFDSYLQYFILLLLGESYKEYLWLTFYILIIGALSCISFILQSVFILYSEVKIYNNIIYLGSILKLILLPLFYYYFNVMGLLCGLISSLTIINIISLFYFKLKS